MGPYKGLSRAPRAAHQGWALADPAPLRHGAPHLRPAKYRSNITAIAHSGSSIHSCSRSNIVLY